ncbi:MAG: 3-deoxy-7-phosphoheptulonate synthase [Ignavibacteria bacterium GWB2_35_12]|nr:MAG: 3-deoxy-7-phosphoheptulonate synthase [Bacteroidetes bacterium RIFOXYB2_FULL_35_7]OGU38797.1 MAG: 3-deoxy-7-phosphoheptulonate synthase [Ignavibacteria bacterium GWB2_35_12]OGU92295.1 MAG: 3-deoxy-7-phosphoheptulonate synthase [Ignavibacteria bacterium RIFOXYA2_FULL_35_10]OGV20293.1 MAG: 3-deoxy-7-phosphoheptulonate synthase [Ignavibacteria bacterium RIFOXYC2_FULL_35_21]
MKEINYKKVYEQFHTQRVIIAGPCAVESNEQINRLARKLKDLGIKFFRAGAFKPRTSPNTFQGLGIEGLRMIKHAADEYGLYVVSEIMDNGELENCYDLIDVIQIGSRSMASYGFLKRIGKATAKDQKPVLLKRGFNATLQELLYAAEYISNEGNPNIILCLRGIRTFEQIDSSMRFTPDLASILELKDKTGFPVLFDPSHSSGNSKYVEDLSKAALLIGADGLLVEVHDEPENALSDGMQAILPEVLKEIIEFSKKI